MAPRAFFRVVGLAIASTALAPSVARADDIEEAADAEPTERKPSEESATPPFRYRSEQQSNRARALVEELLVFGFGYAQYVSDKAANTRDYDLTYDWPSLRSKLLFQSVAFDNNHFPTNWVTHPIAGYFYYGVARGNRLSIGESFLLSAAASTLWEVFGEWREQASVNDLVTTPLTGTVVGESLFQLGGFFQRSRPGVVSTPLSWLFGSLKNVNDLLDGAEVARSERFDALGFPEDEWHRFRLATSIGPTWQDHGGTYLDTRIDVDSRIVTLPDYGREGVQHRWFGSGEVSSIGASFTGSRTGLTDFLLSTEVMPFGYYDHDVRGTEGQTTVTGMRLAFDYGLHDSDRDRRRRLDRIAIVGAGLGFEHTNRLGAFVLDAGFDVLADFAGVDAYALPDYERIYAKAGLTSVLANESYYHGVGATMRPSLRLALGEFDAGMLVRFDSFTAIEALDRQVTDSKIVGVSDFRTTARGWLGMAPSRGVRFEISGTRRIREGRVADLSVSRGETGLLAGVELRF